MNMNDQIQHFLLAQHMLILRLQEIGDLLNTFIRQLKFMPHELIQLSVVAVRRPSAEQAQGKEFQMSDEPVIIKAMSQQTVDK